MKRLYFVALFIMLSFSIFGQKIIFLSHSTVAGRYKAGNGLHQWFIHYNSHNGSSCSISSLPFPKSPNALADYPYDHLNLWINEGYCKNTNEGNRCPDWFTLNHPLIMPVFGRGDPFWISLSFGVDHSLSASYQIAKRQHA